MTTREDWMNIGKVVAGLCALLALFTPAGLSIYSWASSMKELSYLSGSVLEIKTSQTETVAELRTMNESLFRAEVKNESRFLDIERRLQTLESAALTQTR